MTDFGSSFALPNVQSITKHINLNFEILMFLYNDILIVSSSSDDASRECPCQEEDPTSLRRAHGPALHASGQRNRAWTKQAYLDIPEHHGLRPECLQAAAGP